MSDWGFPEHRLPERWIVTPANVLAGDSEAASHCPKPAATLVAFAITNAVVSVLGIIAGYRPFIYTVTFHFFGKRGKKNTILYCWIPPLVFHILANSII